MPPLFTAQAPRVPKRGRDDNDSTQRRQRRTLPVFPPLPPLEGLSEADLETPGDGLAALMLLRQSWQLDTRGVWPPPSSSASASSSSSTSTLSPPRVPFCPPLLIRTQVHSLVADRSMVDREIDALRRRGAVRALRLPSSPTDVALCFESDYRAALLALGGEGEGEAAEAAAAAVAARALAAALPALPGASAVPAEELERLLLHAAHGAKKGRELVKDVAEVDALLAPLLRGGALAREHRSGGGGGGGGGGRGASSTSTSSVAAASAFVLSPPGAGPFTSALSRGRVALEKALRRKRYREAPEAAVIKLADDAARGGEGGGAGSGSGTTGLKGAAAVAAAFLADDGDEQAEGDARARRASLLHRPSLSGRFLVRDALGSGRLVRLRTTAGDMLRLAAERVG